MKQKKHYALINLLFCLALILSNLGLSGLLVTPAQAAGVHRTDAVVLVNSASADYLDFQHFIQPYLDHFGVPYTVINISSVPIPADISDYALIIIGHRQLDIGNTLLSSDEQIAISAAVSAGSGLVNFDNDLALGSSARYQFVEDIFTFTYGGSTSGSDVSFPAGTTHYITERHGQGTSISTTGSMSLAGVTLPGDVTAIATTDSQPFLAVTSHGAGCAVQWGSYDWMSLSVKGPIYGLDDLVWHSLVWAARKPFVMQGMPPFVTMRSDDESGNFEWIHIANEFGIKPWAGLFFHNIDAVEAADLSALTNAGLATASIHAFNGSFFYYNHGVGDFSNAIIAANFAEGTAWHAANNIPISDFVLPHYYEFGTNVFQGLSDWGVEFVGTHMDPGNGYGAPWLMDGPYRLYETGGSSSAIPNYYADFLSVPGHPEFNNTFFNCVTEIRDDAGYEWYPVLADIEGTIGRGTRQTIRALDSMALATLFTHGYYISGNWGPTAPASWRAILQGITDNIESYNPIYVTMDDACRYIRATHNSNISSGTYDPATHQVTTNFTTAAGATSLDVDTMFYLFMDGEGYILVDVPAFTNTTTVEYTIPGPLDHVTVTPNPGTMVAGATLQFTATGYDVDNNPIPNLSFNWSVVNGGGTVDPTGLFTAGDTPGTYTNTIVAARNAVSGSATIAVTAPIIHHFEFAQVTSPKYINAPFTVTIRARDAANNLVVGYVGSVTLSDSTGTIAPATSGAFSGGVWSGQVTIGAVASGVTITAVDGSVTGASNAFEVQAAPTCPCSIWDASAVPDIAHNADSNPLEMGVKFRSATDGYITSLKVYRSTGNMGLSMPAHLWTSAGGSPLAEVLFPAVAAAGWQQIALSVPVPISADTTYIASYHSTAGYPVTRPYFVEANRSAFERPPLRALVDGEEGGNGVYYYGPSGTFPTLTYQSTNYWIDIVFETEPIADTTPPSIVTLSPNDYQPGVSIGTDVTVTFSEAMDPGTISASTFELRGPSNTLVPATLTYDAATNTARLDPSAALAYSTTYYALVVGGEGGVADLAGNELLSNRPWSFTTQAAPLSLDHFEFAAISSPQTAGIQFQVTITARDTAGGIFTNYTDQAVLSASSGTITPQLSGAFVNGTWTGMVSIASPVLISGVTISATDGLITGLSNPFDLQLPPPPPSFFTLTSPSYEYNVDTSFPVTVLAYPGTTINLWEDNHQQPVLVTTEDANLVTPGLPGETDGQWTEFLYLTNRDYPSILAGVNEENYGLPVMRFYAGGIPNGQYQVIANLYDNSPMRYFFGYSPSAPKALSVVTPGGATGTQHREYSLGTITITDGNFNIYVQDADMQPDTTSPYPFFGWAWIRLVPVSEDFVINLWEDAHQAPDLVTTTDPAAILETDGQWTEFLYPPIRPYPTILAGVNEESLGLQVMHFSASGIPNGQYEVFANLYDNAAMRYYFGYTLDNPKALSIETAGGATGTQHKEYSLGTITITDGNFNLYVRDADLISGGYAFFGWAWIRLVSEYVTITSSSPTMKFDGDGDGVFGEVGDNVRRLVNGTFTIQARDTSPGTGVLIFANDTRELSGQATYTILNDPTGVVLTSFTAQKQADSILVSWDTASEVDLLAFNLYRSETPIRSVAPINLSPIPVISPGAFVGNPYEYVDQAIEAGATYYYWLEIVRLNERILIGPVNAGGYTIFIPMIKG